MEDTLSHPECVDEIVLTKVQPRGINKYHDVTHVFKVHLDL